ncbi:MAG: efflux RND transporter periplasmic adaptor subunit [Bacteroidales bacterium]|nr:efflux RND transporter periplasmic adaptor subunit [Bacteroidales bacterium]
MKHIFRIAALALTMGSLIACGGKKEETAQGAQAPKAPEKVKVQKLEKQRIAKNLELSATLEGYETVNIAPSLTGHIEHIYVQVGSRVAKGQMLVRMDQNQLNTTKINLNSTKTEFERVAALKESGNISQQVYDQTKAGYDQLVESARFLEENTFVKAPISGVIAAKNYEDGEMYAGTPILSLTQISRLKAIVSIPESYFPLVRQGMRVDVVSDIYPDRTFPATIEIVYPTIDPATHTFQAKLNIPNSGEKIRPGMYVKTTMALGEVDAIVVPYQAVLKLTGSNERYVFVNDDGMARRVTVTLGQRFDDKIEIVPVKAGDLKEGDELVVTGQARLVDGCALDVVTANSTASNK